MSQATPARFGIMTPPSQVGYDDILRVWREADAVPQIEHVWLYDHLMPIFGSRNVLRWRCVVAAELCVSRVAPISGRQCARIGDARTGKRSDAAQQQNAARRCRRGLYRLRVRHCRRHELPLGQEVGRRQSTLPDFPTRAPHAPCRRHQVEECAQVGSTLALRERFPRRTDGLDRVLFIDFFNYNAAQPVPAVRIFAFETLHSISLIASSVRAEYSTLLLQRAHRFRHRRLWFDARHRQSLHRRRH